MAFTELTSEQLSSETRPYATKSIGVNKFLVPQIALMHKAASLSSLQPMIDAVASCVENIDPSQITVGDFYQILAWQRCHAYTQPLVARWVCKERLWQEVGTDNVFTDAQLSEMVEEYRDATDKTDLRDPDTIQILEVECNNSNEVPVVYDDFEVMKLGQYSLDPRLDIPRVNTLADVAALREDPEEGGIVAAAQWIKEGNTLADKLEILRNQDDLSLFELALQAENTIRHGIRNTIRKQCTKCGGFSRHVIDINPKTFFLV